MDRKLDDVVDCLKTGHRHKRPCSLLIGAGCSVTAGVPTAAGFVELIKNHFPGAYDRAAEKTYPACMAALDTGHRRDLIAAKIREAKLNWGHVAIAQLIQAGYVDRVLTTNFDPLVSRACAMAGAFPAIYDFAASTKFEPSAVAEQAIFHLHGQSTGFAVLNTEEECIAHGARLGPLFADAGRGRSWIVVGYSGDNDPVFQHLAAVTRFEYGLYWAGYRDAEPSAALRSKLLTDGRQAYFVKGYDADRFFVELAQRLECFPPAFVERPFSHLRGALDVLTPFTLPGAETEIDVLQETRSLLDAAILQHEPRDRVRANDLRAASAATEAEPLQLTLTALMMAGKSADVRAIGKRLAPEAYAELIDTIAWAEVMEGNLLSAQAQTKSGADADVLFREAGEKYAEAVRIKPDMHEAFYNWGSALSDQARTKSGDAADVLFREAGEKYAEAVRIKPDMHEAWNNWGSMFLSQATQRSGNGAEVLLAEAESKLRQAEALTPGSGAYNLACVAARSDRADDCRSWLETARQNRSLPDRSHLEADHDLDPVRDLDWFRALLDAAQAPT